MQTPTRDSEILVIDAAEAARLTARPAFRRMLQLRDWIRRLLASAALVVLAALTAVMALFPEVAAAPITDNVALTWGLMATIASIVLAVCIAGVYVSAAEKYFNRNGLDPEQPE